MNPILPLYTLLNIDKLFDQDNPEGKTRRCKNGEILDTFFDKCRALHCFQSSLPFEGKCVPFLDYDIGYKLAIKLVPKEDLRQRELIETDLRNHYIHVQTKLGFKKCRLCQLYMFVEKGSTDILLQEIYIVFVFTPTPRCKTEDIWSKFMAAETKLPLILNLPVNEKLVDFTASWDDARDYRLTHWKAVLEVEYKNKCRPVSPARGEICPKVQLLRHEVEHVKKHHPRADELIWTYMKDGNGSAFVCCNNYISYERSLCSLDYNLCFSLTLSVFLGSLFRYVE
ncbi:uncharacterized protein LOC132729214 [Ruditapes philippinarum]|uniref:uncharacterized protein LOC132729214 n=1 Tax=Ruditapes philippinarum TaxID=129788 RepID=UPI00295A8428|nr:uncharacterized protein LOC132729214 [Ruditapes philippinarum]